jgi:FkbM family methyltransferase
MEGWRAKARAIAAILREGVPLPAEPPPVVAAPPAAEESLIQAQMRLIGTAGPATVLDLGVHHGHSTVAYLESFPACRAFAFEADADNFAAARRMLGARAAVAHVAVCDRIGTATFHVNSHSGTHSLRPIGAQRYWGGHAEAVRTVQVATTTLDAFCAEQGLAHVDILKMDIQGGELAALQGAAGLLARQAIDLIALEVLFQPLYRDQPLFWDIGAYLAGHGYGLYRLFDSQYHPRNDNVLSWADAIFLAPRFLDVPEWERDA